MKLIKFIIFFIGSLSYFIFSINISSAAINFTVTPIKYELEASPGTSITRTAALRNNGNDAIKIITGKSDFQANGTDGIPRFIRKSELVFLDQQLSTWIQIDTPSFIINPGEEVTINFTINIPSDATPGGHYGAVFFKNNNSERSAGADIAIDVDYGVLILLNIEGEVITVGEVDDTEIEIINNSSNNNNSSSSDGGGWGAEQKKDNCPLGDFSNDQYDGKCISTPFDKDKDKNIDTGSGVENTGDNNEKKDFDITFEIPFKNKGNTHIKPKGKIKLVDEDGKDLKGVGKEVITNKLGAIVGERVVDYLPINDIGGNVLPNTKRDFEAKWQGFPYEDYDDKGNKVINYWDPSEYYTNKNIEKKEFLMFWEKVCEKNEHKKITALINLSYKDNKGEDVEFNSAKDFYVSYKEKYIGLNYYIIIPFILFILFVLFFFFILFAKRKKKEKYIECIKCRKKMRKDWLVCPHCSKKQPKK